VTGTWQRVQSAIAHLHIETKGNKHRYNSPLREGSNSKSFVITINGDEHGAYYDHVSEDKGSLYDLAKLLGVATPTRQTIASTKREYAGIKDYAIQHGITEEQLKAWGWSQVFWCKRVALSFPTRNGTRYRYLDGDSSKPTYTSEKGYKSCWYGLHERDTIKTRLMDGLPLVFCNGEISTIAGQENGLASVCVTSGEKSKIPHELMTELKATLFGWDIKPKIIIALDCDDKGRHSARGLIDQFKNEGFETIGIDLGLGHGGDLADFCMLYGDSSQAQLAKCALLPEEKPIPTKSNHTVIGVDGLLALPQIKWLIPRVLPNNGLMAVYGRSGAHKSFYALDLALSLATHSVVLYVAAEGQLGYKQRVEAWQSINQERAQFARFLLGTVDIFDSVMLDEFVATVKDVKPVLVVLDTLAMVSGVANENDTRDMNRIVTGLKRVSVECDSAVMIVHHTGKSGDDERGSSAFRGAMDVMVKLTNEGDIIKVECTKMKDASPFSDHYLKPKRIELGYENALGERVSSLVLEPTKGEQVALNGLTDSQKQTLRAIVALEKQGASNTQRTVTAIARLTGTRTGTTSKHVEKFIKDGLASKNEAFILPTPRAYVLTASIHSTASTASSVLTEADNQSDLFGGGMEARKHGSNQRQINLNHGHY
jgi:hypothetical protein